MFNKPFSVIITSVFLFLLVISCKPKPNVSNIDYNVLGDYVTAYVPSQIDISDEVRVILSKSVDTKLHPANTVLEISPSVDGEYSWIGDREIKFKPNSPLEPGTE